MTVVPLLLYILFPSTPFAITQQFLHPSRPLLPFPSHSLLYCALILTPFFPFPFFLNFLSSSHPLSISCAFYIPFICFSIISPLFFFPSHPFFFFDLLFNLHPPSEIFIPFPLFQSLFLYNLPSLRSSPSLLFPSPPRPIPVHLPFTLSSFFILFPSFLYPCLFFSLSFLSPTLPLSFSLFAMSNSFRATPFDFSFNIGHLNAVRESP